jgi:hypothetical protein
MQYTVGMPDGGKLEEIYKLTKENNQMLRAMRRNARMHTFLKLIFYAVIAGGLIWSYIHIIGPLLMQMLDTLNKLQGASSQAQNQLSGFTDTLQKLTAWIPGASSTKAH